jgi:hypothetical protein
LRLDASGRTTAQSSRLTADLGATAPKSVVSPRI